MASTDQQRVHRITGHVTIDTMALLGEHFRIQWTWLAYGNGPRTEEDYKRVRALTALHVRNPLGRRQHEHRNCI